MGNRKPQLRTPSRKPRMGSVSVCADAGSPIFSLAQAFTPGFMCHQNQQPPLGGLDRQRAAPPQDGSPSTSLRTSPVNGAPKESVGIAHPGLKAWATKNKPLRHYRQIASLFLAAALLASGAAQGVQAQSAEGVSYAVVVTGLGGDATYEKLIQGWGKDLATALRKDGAAAGRVFWLAAKKEEGVHADSRREEIVKVFDQLAGRVRPGDVFELFLIGHGSYDDYDYRLSIPGGDLTASPWAEQLNRIRAEKQVVGNMTSASGGGLGG